jgi:hypothetical protein
MSNDEAILSPDVDDLESGLAWIAPEINPARYAPLGPIVEQRKVEWDSSSNT